ncbi:hypothetical protein VZT92_027031 [Zoarces viviparus]|uniref:Uncharacterized protein n=1 Tax=Zoarces viviparus TaxID=48416 RepID=A0AAW1DUC8_ZOAVI
MLEPERLRLKKENTTLLEETEEKTDSFVNQPEKDKERDIILGAALEKNEQQLERHGVKWQDDNPSLPPGKEQGWKKTERFRLESLKSQFTQKKGENGI